MNFLLPNAFDYVKLNTFLIDYCRNHPEQLKYKTTFLGVEGNFPYAYWSSGKLNNDYTDFISAKEIEKFLTFYAAPLVIDCANPLLIEADRFDVMGNTVLKQLDNGSNMCEISSDWMKEYITSTYSGFYFIASEAYQGQADDFKYYKVATSSLENNPWPKEKSIINVVKSDCIGCSEYSNCYLANWENHLLFSKKSFGEDCKNYTGNAVLLNIDDFIKQGYHNFYFDTTTLYFNENAMAISLVNFFIKSEFVSQALVEYFRME